MKRPYAVAVLAACCALVAAGGCDGKKDRDRQPAEAQPPTTNEPQRGGHLMLPSNEPRYLNPVLEQRVERANMLIYEGLVGLDARLEPVPRLAEKWEISPDGKVITFHLRKNVTWHDGKPFTARDIAFTVDAVKETPAPSVWKAYMNLVEDVRIPDEHTVSVVYAEPYAPALVTWTMPIIPRHVFEGGPLTESPGNTEPVGTGPYKLARWEKGKRLVLQANDAWWFARPHIDTIEIVVDIPEEQVVEALRQNKLDFARVSDLQEWMNRVQLPEFREDFEVSDVIESRIRLIAWNTQREPFDDARVRRALTHAMDRGRIVDDVMLGQARPLSSPFFPTMYGADPSIAPWPFDVDEAVNLLEEAGVAKTENQRFDIDLIALDTQRGPTAESSLAILRDNLRGLGIDLKVTFLPAREFFDRLVLREFDAVYFGWVPDIPDPDPYALLHSSQIGSGANFAGYASQTVDELLEEARTAASKEERKALYYRLHRILHDEMPYTPLYAPYGHYVWNRRARGVSPKDIGSQPRFPGLARWWIAGSK